MIYNAKASHIGSALSIVDLVCYVYFCNKFDLDPTVDIKNRDSFILSKGHACTAVYAALHEAGVINSNELQTYGQDGSTLMHHISTKTRGVDLSTGSLGHGLPFTIGLSLADKINCLNHKRLCLIGDGELAEGSNWEALLVAAHHKLSNIILIIDGNKLQSIKTVNETLNLASYRDKFQSFNWNFIETDGHDFIEIARSFDSLDVDKPTAIYANTIKGKGINFMENQIAWHYKNPTEDEYLAAKRQILSA